MTWYAFHTSTGNCARTANNMLRRSPMKPGTKPLKRTGFVKSSSRVELLEGTKLARQAGPSTRLRTTQRPVTPAEKLLHDAMARTGCIACAIDGRFNDHVSIHHIDGRTKPDCHRKVLPLCAGHHQDGTGNDKTLIAVHPYKARFERHYGSQYALVALVMDKLREKTS